MTKITDVKGLLIDLEGVLYSDNKLIPGSIEVIKELRKNNLKLRFLTNTTTTPRKLIFNKLQDFDFDIKEEEIFTPIIATKNYLRDNRVKKIALVTNVGIIDEFNDYEITQKNPEVVIMGDIYKKYKWEILDRIFKLVYLENSALIALHQNKYCMRDGKISLDRGPFVKAIEYSSGKKSILMGKPEKNFFYLAIKDINIKKDNVLMIGDDIVSDIKGAKDFGVRAIQVKTGKYQNSDCDNKIVQPDERIDSIVDIAKILKGN